MDIRKNKGDQCYGAIYEIWILKEVTHERPPPPPTFLIGLAAGRAAAGFAFALAELIGVGLVACLLSLEVVVKRSALPSLDATRTVVRKAKKVTTERKDPNIIEIPSTEETTPNGTKY